MFQFKNANIIHDTPAGLTEYNFQTMDIDDFIGLALTLYRFAQSKDIDRGSHGYQVWRDVLARSGVFYRQDKPWRTIFNRRQIWCDQAKFQLSLRAQCELQTRFVGSLINASTEAFRFLVLKGKFRLQRKYLGFNPNMQEISEKQRYSSFY